MGMNSQGLTAKNLGMPIYLWLLINGACNPVFQVMTQILLLIANLFQRLSMLFLVTIANLLCAARYRGGLLAAFAATGVVSLIFGLFPGGTLGLVYVLLWPSSLVLIYQSSVHVYLRALHCCGRSHGARWNSACLTNAGCQLSLA